jgi:hypothetical protein
MANAPQPITKSAGECLKVIIGSSGSQYFIADWFSDSQGFSWNQTPNLANHVTQRIRQNRLIKSVAMGQNGEWFVCSINKDGTGASITYGGVSNAFRAHIQTVNQSSMPSLSVALGTRERYVMIWDRNSYAYGPNVERTLIDDMKKRNAAGEEIELVRFVRGGSYYISSQVSITYWPKNMCTHLQQELQKPFEDHGRIIDLCVAGDGSWIVIRPDTFACSKGVHDDVTTKLASFYSSHKARQKKREEEINEYRITEQRRKEKEEKEEAAKKRSRMDEFLFDLQVKKLKPGVRVTVAGVSSLPGDFVVKSVDTAGTVRVGDGYYTDRDMLIKDPRRITRYDDEELSSTEQKFLLTVLDKYEAAVAMYYCVRSDNTCHCKRVAPSSFASPYAPSTGTFHVGDRVSVIGYANATILGNELRKRVLVEYDDGSTYHVERSKLLPINNKNPAMYCALAAETKSFSTSPRKKPILEYRGETLSFDEYKCAEKIDMSRLKKIVDDLTRDSAVRLQMIQTLQGGRWANELWLTHLQRCGDLEMIATTLYNELKDYPADDAGCVVREVAYEHRDPSFRGRLFAIGEGIPSSNSKIPRTTTLQGMHGDLRAPLVGSFAYDIDCENSEVRLLCSLSLQYGLQDLVPILFDYRDNRKKWLDLVVSAHGVTESDAKRLPNIVISGGRLETWRKRFNVVRSTSDSDKVRKFAFDLDTQTRVLRDQLLKHPRFAWTTVDRSKLAEQGRKGGALDRALLPRIIQYGENEVLRILHRTCHLNGWIVRAKVFDGLILERGVRATGDLESSLRSAERSCQLEGWDVHLAEKPLHGKQDDSIQTVDDARAALLAAHKAISRAPVQIRRTGVVRTIRN